MIKVEHTKIMKRNSFYLFYFLYIVSNSFLQPILPHYLNKLNFSQEHYGYSIAFFYFVSFLFSLLCPLFIKKIKLKKNFLIGLICCCGSSYLFYKTNSLLLFYLARLFQGISQGILLVCFLTYFFTFASNEKQIYFYTFIQIMASTAGYFLGTWIVHKMSFTLFFIQIGLSILLIFYLLWLMDEPQVKEKQKREVESKRKITPFFLSLFCMTLAYFLVENWFNLYLFDEINYSLQQSMNIRFQIFLISFVVYVLFYFIFKKVKDCFLYVLLGCSLLLFVTYWFIRGNQGWDVLFFYFGISNLFLPLQQTLLKTQINAHLGTYQGVRFLAMMCSSLFFNYLYQQNNQMILLISSAGFLIAGIDMRLFLIKNR